MAFFTKTLICSMFKSTTLFLNFFPFYTFHFILRCFASCYYTIPRDYLIVVTLLTFLFLANKQSTCDLFVPLLSVIICSWYASENFKIFFLLHSSFQITNLYLHFHFLFLHTRLNDLQLRFSRCRVPLT